MTLIPGISALSPIIGQELDGQTFKAVSGQLVLNVDPASSISVTSGANGLSFSLPTVLPTTVTTAVTGTGADKSLIVTVNGIASNPIVVGTSDALVIGGTPTAPTIAVTGGTPVAFPVQSSTNAGLMPASGSAAPADYLAADGTYKPLPLAPATTNVLSSDALAKTITSTVNGVASTISTAGINEDGTTLSFSAGTLQLKNAAGTVISSSPIPDLDAQTLTIGGTTAAPTLAISGGNTVNLPAPPAAETVTWNATTNAVTLGSGSSAIVPAYSATGAGLVPAVGSALPADYLAGDGTWKPLPVASVPTCASISALYPASATAPTATTSFLGSDCSSYKTVALTSAFGTPIGRIFVA